MRTPTEKQYDKLRVLAGGHMLVSGIGGERRVWLALLNHGWVAPDDPKRDPENGLRITPQGLRALADAVEAYGLPSLAPQIERKEPLLVQELRAARDEAREERDEARREARVLRYSLNHIGAAVAVAKERAEA